MTTPMDLARRAAAAVIFKDVPLAITAADATRAFGKTPPWEDKKMIEAIEFESADLAAAVSEYLDDAITREANRLRGRVD